MSAILASQPSKPHGKAGRAGRNRAGRATGGAFSERSTPTRVRGPSESSHSRVSAQVAGSWARMQRENWSRRAREPKAARKRDGYDEERTGGVSARARLVLGILSRFGDGGERGKDLVGGGEGVTATMSRADAQNDHSIRAQRAATRRKGQRLEDEEDEQTLAEEAGLGLTLPDLDGPEIGVPPAALSARRLAKKL
jgi:hypothetical protein